MSEKKVLVAIVVITVLALFGGVFFLSKGSTPSEITASQNAKVSVDQKAFDWGKINMQNGNVNKTFVIKNTGTETLKLNKVKTSCHCTKAQIIINGTASPSFGMNTVSPWVGEVAPGSETQLNVVFDPAYHGVGGLGPVTRYVSVQTNDASNPNLEFTLTANVVKE